MAFPHSVNDRLMKIRLELVHKNAKIKKVVLKADTVIGRSTECGLRIASNEVSRQHCKICLSEDGVTVRDLGSSNGTFINGYQLEQETDYEIAPDSELSIGGIKFIVRFEGSKAKAMQVDGLGSTVDLKPSTSSLSDEHPEQIQIPDPALEETAQFASADEVMESATGASAESDPSMQSTQDELELADDEAIVELEAVGDSAILEQSAGPTERGPDPEYDSALGKFFQNFD